MLASSTRSISARHRSLWRLRELLATTPNNTRGALAGCPHDLGIARSPHRAPLQPDCNPTRWDRTGQDGTKASPSPLKQPYSRTPWD